MKYIIIAGILIVIGFLIALSYIPIGIEPLTEVYFEEHTKLPKYLFLNKSYNFSFTVHNLEYIPMNYSYEINIEYGNKTIGLDRGEIALGNNESRTIFESLKILENFEKARIGLEIKKLFENSLQKDPNLMNRTIDLHFWVEEITGPKIIITQD